MSSDTVKSCCLTGFAWAGTPAGTTGTLAANRAYITGTNKHVAILVVHDAFGWEFPNTRLLADHLAREVDATVFVPDFFEGEPLPWDLLLRADGMAALRASGELAAFLARNGRAAREPEVLACARALRAAGFRRVGASGYCFGGWACFRLASAAHRRRPRRRDQDQDQDQDQGRGQGHHDDDDDDEEDDEGAPLVDAISVGHPSMLVPEDVDGVGRRTAVQLLAPEVDHAFDAGLKAHAFAALQARGVAFEYRHFPGVEHACLIRGDERKEGEREAMVRGKNAAVAWYREWLHGVKE